MHTPVLLKEVIKSLNIRQNGVYLDLTVGYGGHASAILERATKGFLVGIDKDKEALKFAQKRLELIGSNFQLIHGDFRNLPQLLAKTEIKHFDGILGDFGVSSPQIDSVLRGFSYQRTAPLDMRFNQEQTLTADFVVNQMSQEELSRIFDRYGYKGSGKPLAAAICRARPLTSTTQLVEVVRNALPAYLVRKKNPAKLVFQALRIFVNDEIEALLGLLETLDNFTAPTCVIALITFHSLEDRIVKNYFGSKTALCDNYRRVVPAHQIFTTKAFRASVAEVFANPRARSAKLRVLWKTTNQEVKDE